MIINGMDINKADVPLGRKFTLFMKALAMKILLVILLVGMKVLMDGRG